MISECPKCKVPLVMGTAIEPRPEYRSIVPTKRTITAKELKLIDCLKCPKCGYSDDGK